MIVTVTFGYENLALQKPAWQQFPYWNKPWGADKAVDGLYSDRSADGGQCTISKDDQQTATWRVDLGEVHSIRLIKIYYRTDNVEWDSSNDYTARFLGMSVYVSNTTEKNEGVLCFKDSKYTRTTIPNTITIECIKHGRYVIYYNERLPWVTYPAGYSQYAFNELCELEIFGCSTSGVFGKHCNVPCPQNCQEGHCDIVNGTCLGCVAGYKGERCKKKYVFE
ncbi:uncharacterized protein LOC134267698 [Saccostrea cucullata]|uniref:uncharacterized protein LOC134267698 n=1 Tax=Saccostrea cuccullata TaxID=36930 RepID=UPI002ED0C816